MLATKGLPGLIAGCSGLNDGALFGVQTQTRTRGAGAMGKLILKKIHQSSQHSPRIMSTVKENILNIFNLLFSRKDETLSQQIKVARSLMRIRKVSKRALTMMMKMMMMRVCSARDLGPGRSRSLHKSRTTARLRGRGSAEVGEGKDCCEVVTETASRRPLIGWSCDQDTGLS